MSGLKLFLLGPPQIELDGTPIVIRRSKGLALLSYLAVNGEPQRRDTLATLLWPNSSQSRARSYLRNELSLLNKALGGAWLEIEGETIGLGPGVWLDVTQFQRGLTDFERDTPATHPALSQTITLYRDDFLTGFTLADCPDFDEWQFFQTESLRQSLATALADWAVVLNDQRDYEAAIPHARRLLALDVLHEPAHQMLMRLYALSGRQAAALRQFSECQRILRDELGLEPEAATQALAEAIRKKQLRPADGGASIHFERPGLIDGDGVAPDQVQVTEARPLFIGREPQLAQLRQALDQTLSGHGQLRLISGEAGAGKSALVAEFIHRTVSTQAKLIVAIGMCDAQTGSLDPYLPFREALMTLLLGNRAAGFANVSALTSGVTPMAKGTQPSREVACRALLEHGPHLLPLFVPPADWQTVINSAQRAGWQGEPLAVTTTDQNLEQSRIFEQMVAVLQAIAAQRPLLLVLEDLHWADSSSRGLLFRLARQLAGQTIMVVGTYRPEAVRAGPQRPADDQAHPLQTMLLELQRNLGDITIDLEAARRAEGRALVDGLLDAEPNHLDLSFRQALHHQTNGHPLFVVELVQELKKSGALIQDEGGHWVIGAELDWLNLPIRVEGAIAGRMAHLSEAQRWFLTIASVMGERFLVEVVAHVAGVEPRELAHTLSRILQREHRLVDAEGVDRLGERRLTRYRFRHNLMQVYLYERLDEVQRIYLHEDVANALELLYGEDVERIALQLAHHFLRAGVTQKAIDYLILAGEQAMRLLVFEEAAYHFTQALTLLSDLPVGEARDRQELTLQTFLGQVWTASKGAAVSEVGVAYTRALDLARQLGEGRKAVELLFALTQYAQMRSELSAAQAYGEEALRLAELDQDPELLMQVNKILHNIAYWGGRHRDALAYNDQVIAFYRTGRPGLNSEDAIHLAYALVKSGLNLVPCGYPDRAVQIAQEGLALMKGQDYQFGAVVCTGYLAMIHSRRREWSQVIHLTTAAIEACHKYDLVQAQTLNELNQGLALAMLGEFEAGVKLVRQAIAEREAINSAYGNQDILGRLAEAYGPAGRVVEGLALVNEVLDSLEQTNERESEPELYQIKGDLLLLQELSDAQRATARQEAESCFCRAIEIAHHRQTKLWEVRALAKLCQLLHAQGRGEECRQQLADLYGWFTEGFETEDLQVVRAVLAMAV
jgi:DNA-binding SARP family transcriptional activator